VSQPESGPGKLVPVVFLTLTSNARNLLAQEAAGAGVPGVETTEPSLKDPSGCDSA
jgi:hypothetical protein